ncbi:MAG: hypothetical protein JOS17DRAFT_211603 [Linnemannia elongata]|nr:MAG: hypothetical protein JOS17DRAFT_211603 [Linnemannia elongata]
MFPSHLTTLLFSALLFVLFFFPGRPGIISFRSYPKKKRAEGRVVYVFLFVVRQAKSPPWMTKTSPGNSASVEDVATHPFKKRNNRSCASSRLLALPNSFHINLVFRKGAPIGPAPARSVSPCDRSCSHASTPSISYEKSLSTKRVFLVGKQPF